jgi:hypothetical protein
MSTGEKPKGTMQSWCLFGRQASPRSQRSSARSSRKVISSVVPSISSSLEWEMEGGEADPRICSDTLELRGSSGLAEDAARRG